MPGPLFAVTMERAKTHKTAGIFIALGHGVVEFPLMILVYLGLTRFVLPQAVQVGVGLVGGLLMIFMALQNVKKRNTPIENGAVSKQDSLVAGIWTTAANAGFILWWLTIGTTLIIYAKYFGLLGFSAFAIAHWSCDFVWYSLIALTIFRSHLAWPKMVHQLIFIFCFSVLMFFGAYFFGSALWTIITVRA